jgi:hypothetical protein
MDLIFRSFGRNQHPKFRLNKKKGLQNEQLWFKNTKLWFKNTTLGFSKTRSFSWKTQSFGSKNPKFRFVKPEVSVRKTEVWVRKPEVSGQTFQLKTSVKVVFRNASVYSNSKFRVCATDAFRSEKSTETSDNSTEVSSEINGTFESV